MEKIDRLTTAAGPGNNLNEVKSLIENDRVDINSKDTVNKSFSFFLYFILFYFSMETQLYILPVVMEDYQLLNI